MSSGALTDGKKLLLICYYWKARSQTFVKYHRDKKKVHVEMINFSFKASFEYRTGNLWPYATYSTIRRRGKTHQD